MPKVGSIGWVNIQGATQFTVNHNAASLDENVSIPAGHNSLLIGPITIEEGIVFTIAADSQVKIKRLRH